MKKTALLILLTLSVSLSAQTIYYVKPAGNNGWDGRENVYTNIQTAINAAALSVADANVQVWIAQGTYTLTQPLEPQNRVDVIGGFSGNETNISERSFVGKGKNVTILDGDNKCQIIYQNNGLSYPVCWSNLIIENGNALGNGGGVWLNSNMTLKGCIIRDNIGQSAGGGAYLNGNACLINCLVVRNLIKKEDPSLGGIGVYCKDESKVINCTVADNSGSTVRGISGLGIHATDNAFIGNTIVWGNSTNYGYDGDAMQIYVKKNAEVSYCAIANGCDQGENIINLSPINTGHPAVSFIDPKPGNNWNISESSVCIDAGNNDLIAGEEFDLNGKKRILNGHYEANIATVDIGAFEFGEDDINTESGKVSDVQFYPNPCSGILYQTTKSDNPCTVKIITLSGVVLYKGEVSSSSINLGSLPKGNYLLQWQTSTESGAMPLLLK